MGFPATFPATFPDGDGGGDTYGDTYSDLYGGDGGGDGDGGGATVSDGSGVFFDGAKRPRMVVTAGFGGLLDPGASYIHLGTGPGLGTGLLSGPDAGTNEVDVTADVRSVSISQRGPSSDVDAADPVTATIVVSNRRGDYDPSNPTGPYWGVNALTAQQRSLEDTTTSGWFAGSATTIANTATQAYEGTRALQLTKTGSTGILYANTPAVDLGQGASVRFPPAAPCRAVAHFRANTTGRPCRVRVAFYDANGTYISDLLGDPITDTTSGWVETTVGGVSPATTDQAAVELQAASNGAGVVGEVHYADGVTLQSTGLVDGTPLRVRWVWNELAYDRFYGELADVRVNLDLTPDATATLVANDAQDKLSRAYLPDAQPQRDGDTTGERIAWLADQAAQPSALRAIDAGYTTLAPTALGASAMDLMRKAEQTEFGLLFVDGAGRLVFYDRHRGALNARSTTVQATFGDPPGAIGITDLELAHNRERTFNRVAITREAIPNADVAVIEGQPEPEPSDDDPVEQVADDPTTQATKGILAFPAEVGQLLRNDFDALALAQYLVARFKTTVDHVSEIQVNALRGGWDDLLPLGPLDRVAVVRDYGPNTVSVQLHVQGVAEDVQVSPPSWQLTFSTSNPPVAPTLFVVGTGQLGSTTNGRLGW